MIFSATGVAGPAAILELVSGDEEDGVAGTFFVLAHGFDELGDTRAYFRLGFAF